MISYFLILAFTATALIPSNEPINTIEWHTLDELPELLKKEPKKVFVDVVADWCKWCKVMEKETFSNDKVIQYINEHYYAVRMDYESQANVSFNGEESSSNTLAKSWNVRDLPAIVFWDEELQGKFLVTGFQNAEDFLKSLKAFEEF